MTVPADRQKDARNGKQGEHLLARFRASISPSVNAGIQALGYSAWKSGPVRFFVHI